MDTSTTPIPGAPVTPPPAQGVTDPVTMTPESMSGAQTPGTTATPPASTQGTALTAGVNAASDSFTQQLEANTQATEKGATTSLQTLLDALNGQQGQNTLTANEYAANGVDANQQALTDVNNKILAEKQALTDSITGLKGKAAGYTTQGLADETQRLQDASLLRQASLATVQLAAQAKYADAKAIADRAVAMKYEQQQNKIDTLKYIYEQNKDLFTTAQKQQFDTAQADRASQLDLQKQETLAEFNSKIATQKAANDYRNQYGAYPAGYDPSTGTYGDTGGDGSTSDPIAAASAAILGNESNGSYTAVSQPTPSGGRSYGKYQVLDSNIPSWTKQYYGQSLTPAQFLSNSAAQEAVQKGKITELWNKYGNIRDVASVYFSGQPYSDLQAKKSDGYTTVQQYVDKAEKAFNQNSGTSTGGSPLTNNVPTTDEQALNSSNPNDQAAYSLATGSSAPSQILTARNISGTSAAGRLILARANAISEAKYGVPFSMQDAEAAYKVRNSTNYQTYITSAPNAVRAISEVMTNLKTLQDGGYLAGISGLNSIKLKLMASGIYPVPQAMRSAAANVLSTMSQSQDDIGKLLGTGQGSDAKIALAGKIFDQQGNLNTTSAVANNVTTNITQKLGDMFSAAGVKTDSPAFKAEMERIQPSIDAINGSNGDQYSSYRAQVPAGQILVSRNGQIGSIPESEYNAATDKKL